MSKDQPRDEAKEKAKAAISEALPRAKQAVAQAREKWKSAKQAAVQAEADYEALRAVERMANSSNFSRAYEQITTQRPHLFKAATTKDNNKS